MLVVTHDLAHSVGYVGKLQGQLLLPFELRSQMFVLSCVVPFRTVLADIDARPVVRRAPLARRGPSLELQKDVSSESRIHFRKGAADETHSRVTETAGMTRHSHDLLVHEVVPAFVEHHVVEEVDQSRVRTHRDICFFNGE